jgi:hypothetical protein
LFFRSSRGHTILQLDRRETEINLLITLKYKRVNRTCCDTCTHWVLITEYLCIVWWYKLCSWVWWQTWLIALNQLTIRSVYVSVSLSSSHVKSKILTICPIQAPYNHEDSPEIRDMFADCVHCPNHPWESQNYPWKSLKLTNKEGNASRRHTVADNRIRSENLLGRRRPTQEEHPPSGQRERLRAVTP